MRRWARVSDPAPGPTAGLLKCVLNQHGVADRGHTYAGRPSVGLCGSVGDRPQRIRRRAPAASARDQFLISLATC